MSYRLTTALYCAVYGLSGNILIPACTSPCKSNYCRRHLYSLWWYPAPLSTSAGSEPATGASSGTRTRDPLITNQLLYQLSYRSMSAVFFRVPPTSACGLPPTFLRLHKQRMLIPLFASRPDGRSCRRLFCGWILHRHRQESNLPVGRSRTARSPATEVPDLLAPALLIGHQQTLCSISELCLLLTAAKCRGAARPLREATDAVENNSHPAAHYLPCLPCVRGHGLRQCRAKHIWLQRWDSNPRPSRYERDELPLLPLCDILATDGRS